jgi:hypothetical protein
LLPVKQHQTVEQQPQNEQTRKTLRYCLLFFSQNKQFPAETFQPFLQCQRLSRQTFPETSLGKHTAVVTLL